MKKNFCLIALLLLPLAGYCQAKWYQLEAHEFFRLEEAHSLISLAEPDYSLIEAAVFHASNQERIKHGLKPLAYSEALTTAAQTHSKEMQRFKFFSHTNPRRSALKTPRLRINRSGGNFKGIGENIAETIIYHLFNDNKAFVNQAGELVDDNADPLLVKTYGELAQIVVGQWMDSKSHKENILGNFNYLGCGVSVIYNKGKGNIPQVLVTQNFGWQP